MMSRILLTGATGQVGSAILPLLRKVGTVYAPTRAELDMSQAASVQRTIRSFAPHVIVNAAAYTAVDRAESDEEAARSVNETAPGIIGEEARRLKASVIHFSTDYVFDGTKQSPYVETDRTGPLGVYGRTKAGGEVAIAETGAATLILRTSWVFAAAGANFLRTILRLARERPEIRVVDDQVGSPTSARFLALATSEIVTRCVAGDIGRAGSAVYHLTAKGSTTWYGFAHAIIAGDPFKHEHIVRSVIPIGTKQYPTPAKRPQFSVLDCSRFDADFGIERPDWSAQLKQVMQDVAEDRGSVAK